MCGWHGLIVSVGGDTRPLLVWRACRRHQKMNARHQAASRWHPRKTSRWRAERASIVMARVVPLVGIIKAAKYAEAPLREKMR